MICPVNIHYPDLKENPEKGMSSWES